MANSSENIDALIAEINSKGWRISTLNQISSGMWMAAVQKPGFFSSGFGQAATHYQALYRAWTERDEPQGDKHPVKPATVAVPPRSERVRLQRRS